MPDTAPGGDPTGEGLTINDLGGNVVVLQLAPDLFAFYFHLAPDSITVKVGDTVTKGQAIAQLGNSGNSSARISTSSSVARRRRSPARTCPTSSTSSW